MGTALTDLQRRLRAAAAGALPRAPSSRALFELGRRHALLFFGFVLFSIERAIQRGAPKVYYLTREGIFLRKLHARIAQQAPPGLEVPPSELLEVSRLSTFFPSLREFSPAELMRLWNLYPAQSPRAFCATLGVDGPLLAPHFARHRMDFESTVPAPGQDPRIRAFLEDSEVQSVLAGIRAGRRELLLRYLSVKDIRPGRTSLFIVDVGWRGTIQDNLAYLLPGTTIHGAYFGLKPFVSEQPPNTTKVAFGPNENCDDPAVTLPIHHVAPLEMLTNAPVGSVVGYVARQGGAGAVYQRDAREDRVFQDHVRFFQDGVLSAADTISDWLRTFALTAAQLRPACLRLLWQIMCDAPAPLARAYFCLHHNETFGLGRFADRPTRFPCSLACRAALSRAKWRELRHFLDETGWPQGFLRHTGLGCLCRPYTAFVAHRRQASAKS